MIVGENPDFLERDMLGRGGRGFQASARSRSQSRDATPRSSQSPCAFTHDDFNRSAPIARPAAETPRRSASTSAGSTRTDGSLLLRGLHSFFDWWHCQQGTPSVKKIQRSGNPSGLNVVDDFAKIWSIGSSGQRISAGFVSRPRDERTAPRVSDEIWRIVQEALVDIQKHSGVHNVLVGLDRRKDQWPASSTMMGRDSTSPAGYRRRRWIGTERGPRVIKERVRVLGGSLVVHSTPGVGARLEITGRRPRERR